MEQGAYREGGRKPQTAVRHPGCIEHREHERLSICREDYLFICEGHHAAAHLLNCFEFWHNVRLTEVEQERARAVYQPGYRPNLSMVVYKSYKDLNKDLLGEYGEDKLREGILLLKRKRFTTQERTPDPWKRTKAYRFQPEAVQAALRDYWKSKSLETHTRKIGDGRDRDVPEAREIGERPREVADGNPKTERCSYKGTACESTACESTAIPGQNKNSPFYEQNQRHSERTRVARDERHIYLDDGPEFNQVKSESTCWNPDPGSDDFGAEY
jgi:hypothetical protein